MEWHELIGVIGRFSWRVMAPDNLLLWLLVLAFICQFVRPKLARRLWGAATLSAVVIALLPVDSLLLRPLEQRFQTPSLPLELSAIVVLGGSQAPSLAHHYPHSGLNNHSERLWAAAALARQYPGAKLLFIGGTKQSRFGQLKESTVATRYFLQMGINPSQLLVDDRSADTADNARYAKALLHRQRQYPGSPWVLVTSASHMPRAMAAFLQQGMAPLPYPVDFRTLPRVSWLNRPDLGNNLQRLTLALHEWIGLASYYLMGHSNVLFPDPQDVAKAHSDNRPIPSPAPFYPVDAPSPGHVQLSSIKSHQQ